MSALLPNITTAQETFTLKANGMKYPVISALFGGADYCNAAGYTGEWVIGLDNLEPFTNACGKNSYFAPN